jgi:hypothetical protein
MSVMKWIRNQWDRVAAVGLMVAAALAMLAGWLGVSRSAYPAESMPYIVSGGFFGLLLIGIGAVLWLSADLRDEWRKLDSIEQAWRDTTTRLPAETPAASRTVQGGEPARATTAAR